ncbi:hypothetical protein ColLi_11277 [Colletotrichum liriopes]|uniref:Uncharacterized protein n=1 Tax=Colletotrichum liriopes TaxID=708192 RepID=A0AA37GW59_9PEZI|nr:hypothetical protein ColLi_11277 [Colletotrichum liriopes]
MSIQKAVASAFAVTQETTVALASLNFDFSLFKVDAPASFKGLGNELTSTRKKAAEEGTPHITARKLGALFQYLLPSTPALIQAYGHRVTQIASRRDVNPKATMSTHGLFADHVGIDGTSIWAAATSGPESIAVHLLTCMLARMWTAPEAISIWVELVAQRKRELQSVADTETLHLGSIEASRITLSRDQLAEWDASARAWLRAADDAMGIKQKQLMLILNNISIPVNKSPSVYQSVLNTWKSSMLAVDKLVQGMPQSIQDGSVLLGLASWHIYPDMLVLGEGGPKEVSQQDDLVTPGALLTIGLHMRTQDESGVYWSLPLSHLRYYGRPVVSKRSLEDQASRLTFEQLLLVALGSLTKTWNLGPEEIANCLRGLWDGVSETAPAFCAQGTTHWLGLLARAADLLLDPDSFTKRTATQLLKLGMKRASNFVLSTSEHFAVPSTFGLLEFRTYFSLLTVEGKIAALRLLASQLDGAHAATFIIRYEGPLNWTWEYATAIPIFRHSSKRNVEGDLRSSSTHVRWLSNTSRTKPYRLGEEAISLESKDLNVVDKSYSYNNIIDGDCIDSISWTESGDAICLLSHINAQGNGSSKGLGKNEVVHETLFYLAGDQTVSLFWSGDPLGMDSALDSIVPTHVHLDDVITASRNGGFRKTRFMEYLQEFIAPDSRRALRASFRALATISKIYKLLPDATIGLGVTSMPLHEMPWAIQGMSSQNTSKFSAFPAEWATTFACIIQLESGSLSVRPSVCKKVMAISVGDSLYVAAPLLCDPIENPSQDEVRRIRGNVGTPGIAMLIPPANIEPPEFDAEKWNLINHAPYDGCQENSFHSTSLHLSFTGFTLPVDVGTKGFKDTELYYMETRVTAHDHGKEIGDLDILGSLGSGKLSRAPSCGHANSGGQSPNTAVTGNAKLTMIDNWYELLDGPETAAIARSSGNWLGRLALSIVGHQLGHHIVIGPSDICWVCMGYFWKDMREKDSMPSDEHNKSQPPGFKTCLDYLEKGDEGDDIRGGSFGIEKSVTKVPSVTPTILDPPTWAATSLAEGKQHELCPNTGDKPTQQHKKLNSLQSWMPYRKCWMEWERIKWS